MPHFSNPAVLDVNALVFSKYENYAYAHHLCSTETGDDIIHFQATTYLFHIWCADEQKEHPPLPGAVMAFFVILAPDTKLPTYLLTYVLILYRILIIWSMI